MRIAFAVVVLNLVLMLIMHYAIVERRIGQTTAWLREPDPTAALAMCAAEDAEDAEADGAEADGAAPTIAAVDGSP